MARWILFQAIDDSSGNEWDDLTLVRVPGCKCHKHKSSALLQLHVGGIVASGARPSRFGKKFASAWNGWTGEAVRLVVGVIGFSKRIARQELHHLYAPLGRYALAENDLRQQPCCCISGERVAVAIFFPHPNALPSVGAIVPRLLVRVDVRVPERREVS